LPHVRFDRKRSELATARQISQRAPRAMHEVADALNVEDHKILAKRVDDALEFTDHFWESPVAPSRYRASLGEWETASGTPIPRRYRYNKKANSRLQRKNLFRSVGVANFLI